MFGVSQSSRRPDRYETKIIQHCMIVVVYRVNVTRETLRTSGRRSGDWLFMYAGSLLKNNYFKCPFYTSQDLEISLSTLSVRILRQLAKQDKEQNGRKASEFKSHGKLR